MLLIPSTCARVPAFHEPWAHAWQLRSRFSMTYGFRRLHDLRQSHGRATAIDRTRRLNVRKGNRKNEKWKGGGIKVTLVVPLAPFTALALGLANRCLMFPQPIRSQISHPVHPIIWPPSSNLLSTTMLRRTFRNTVTMSRTPAGNNIVASQITSLQNLAQILNDLESAGNLDLQEPNQHLLPPFTMLRSTDTRHYQRLRPILPTCSIKESGRCLAREATIETERILFPIPSTT